MSHEMGEYIVPCVIDVSSIYPSPQIPDGSVQSSFILKCLLCCNGIFIAGVT